MEHNQTIGKDIKGKQASVDEIDKDKIIEQLRKELKEKERIILELKLKYSNDICDQNLLYFLI